MTCDRTPDPAAAPSTCRRPTRAPSRRPATLPCDVVILDLEDSVAPDAKAEARALAVEAVRAGGFGRARAGDPGERPRHALGRRRPGRRRRRPRPDAVLVPKVSAPDDLAAYRAALGPSARRSGR